MTPVEPDSPSDPKTDATTDRAPDGQFRYAATHDLHAARGLHNYHRYVARLFARALPQPATEELRALDFGAGLGTVTRLFAAETGIRPRAFDADAGHVAHLRSAGFETVERIEDVADASLHFILSSNVLEHIADDRAALALLRRKLMPGGVLALYVPAFMSLWSQLDDDVGHMRRYTRAELTEKAAAAGFAIVQAHYCDSLSYLVWRLLRRWIKIAAEMPKIVLHLYDRVLFPLSRMADVAVGRRFGKNLFLVARRLG